VSPRETASLVGANGIRVLAARMGRCQSYLVLPSLSKKEKAVGRQFKDWFIDAVAHGFEDHLHGLAGSPPLVCFLRRPDSMDQVMSKVQLGDDRKA